MATGTSKVTDLLPSRGPRSPFSVGGRTLLARTCKACGELLDGDSFPLLNRGTKNETRRRVCHRCQNDFKKRKREDGEYEMPTARPAEALQTSKYRLWSAEDDQRMRDALTRGLTYEEIAVLLGRSLRAIYKRRSDLGLAKVRKQHRVARPWTIQRNIS